MSRRPIWVAIVAVAIIASGVGWEIASPWLTLRNLQEAARAKDGEKLASYVDFPRVRASLREQLMNRVETGLGAPIFDAAVKERAGVIIDPIIDFIVSPESLQIALDVVPKSEPSSSGTTRPCGMKRDGLNHFRVRCARLPNGSADLVFERQGFAWRLVGINLPDDYAAAVP